MNQEVGVIYPPSDIRNIVDLTAGKVAKNGISFENKIRELKRGDVHFSFLNQTDEYHPYYRSMIQKFLRAELNPGEEADKEASDSKQDSNLTNDLVSNSQPPPPVVKEAPLPPPPYQFLSDLPPVSALDLNGQQFRASLVQKEGRNYQFDFLKPGHSLFPHYNRLVEQYHKVILPPKSISENLSKTNKQQILKNVMKRVDYTLYEESLRKKAAEEEDKERIAFASIDWHDFVVVQTLEFTETDQKLDLPGPTKKEDLITMSFAEKRAVALGRPVDELVLDPIPPPPEPMPLAQGLVPALPVPPPPPPMVEFPVQPPSVPSPVAPVAPTAAPTSMSSMKIRRDYVPKLGAREGTRMEICPVCNRKYASTEIAEHMRVCSLDPKSKEQKAIYESKHKNTNLLKENIDVRKNLTQFSSHRSDLFGVESSEVIFSKKVNEEEEKHKQSDKENSSVHSKVGAPSSSQIPIQSSISTESTQMHSTPVAKANHPIEEQIAAIQRKVEALPTATNVAPPPPLVPLIPQPPPPVQLPFNPPPPPMPIANTLPIPPAPPVAGFVPPPPPFSNIAPPRVPPFSSNGSDAKKIKLDVNTSLVSEQQWSTMNQGPISIVISVANEPSKPEWNLKGQKLELTNLNSSSTIKQLKEQLHSTLGIPSAQQKLSYQLGSAPPQITKNEYSLAYYNFGPNANIQLGIKQRGGKK